jgi:hypothetical protein
MHGGLVGDGQHELRLAATDGGNAKATGMNMSDEKTSAEELVREAYSQGVADGHAMNKAIGIPAQIVVARAIDAERNAMLATLKAVVARLAGNTSLADDDVILAAQLTIRSIEIKS